jgi:N-acylneuraminate cytidylyltransferase
MKDQYVGAIFARGGSKGLPKKNIKYFNGKPLIAWAIQDALSIDRISRVIVSTDCEEIARTAIENGAEVPFLRPKQLAGDTSPEFLAWRHAIDHLHRASGYLPKALVSIPTTSPLRVPLDIENCLNCYEKGNADAVITVTESHRNPYFNMVRREEDSSFNLVCGADGIARRQDAPNVFDMCTIAYVLKPSFVLAKDALFDGRVEAVEIPKSRSIDIDSALDFELAEFLHKKFNLI